MWRSLGLRMGLSMFSSWNLMGIYSQWDPSTKMVGDQTCLKFKGFVKIKQTSTPSEELFHTHLH